MWRRDPETTIKAEADKLPNAAPNFEIGLILTAVS
jgi:hypothetical protein